MNKKLIKSFAIAFALTLTVSTTAFAESMSSTQGKPDSMSSTATQTSMTSSQSTTDSMSSSPSQTGGMNVSIAFENTPVKAGENSFKIMIENSDKKPVSGAQIKTTFDMDRSKMDTMGMKDPIVVSLKEDKPGEYSGTVNLPNAGKWMAKTALSISGQNSSKDFDVTVESAGPNMLVIGGFVGAIALIIIIALIVKKKSKSKA